MATMLTFAVKYPVGFDIETRREHMNRTSLNRVYRFAAFAAMSFAVGGVVYAPLAVAAVAFGVVALRAYRAANPNSAVFTVVEGEPGVGRVGARHHYTGVKPSVPAINPTTGYPMVGRVDTHGNAFGCGRRT